MSVRGEYNWYREGIKAKVEVAEGCLEGHGLEWVFVALESFSDERDDREDFEDGKHDEDDAVARVELCDGEEENEGWEERKQAHPEGDDEHARCDHDLECPYDEEHASYQVDLVSVRC